MNLTITPVKLSGTVTPPPSKSQAHRAILAQLLAGGGTVSNLAASQDIEATRRCAAALKTEGDGLPLGYVHAGGEGVITLPPSAAHMPVGALQDFLDRYLMDHKGRVDYIHGEDVAREFAARPGNIAFLLPPMEKEELFPSVIHDGVLPRKTFSMGEAHDKRFYLEARKIR